MRVCGLGQSTIPTDDRSICHCTITTPGIPPNFVMEFSSTLVVKFEPGMGFKWGTR